jgi:hypothetical protein
LRVPVPGEEHSVQPQLGFQRVLNYNPGTGEVARTERRLSDDAPDCFLASPRE